MHRAADEVVLQSPVQFSLAPTTQVRVLRLSRDPLRYPPNPDPDPDPDLKTGPDFFLPLPLCLGSPQLKVPVPTQPINRIGTYVLCRYV